MADAILTRANQQAALDAFTTAMAATSKLALFTNNVTPTKGMALSQFVLATSTGLGPKTLATWSEPYTDESGKEVVTGAPQTFIVTAGTPDEVIYGWLVLDMAAAVVEAGAALDKPVPISVVGDGLTVVPTIPYGA